MRFLKTLLWIILTIVMLVFTFNNWTPVTVLLWDSLQLDTKIPILVIGAFLLGFLPLWFYLRAFAWRMRRRIASLESSVAARPAVDSAPISKPVAPETHSDNLSSI